MNTQAQQVEELEPDVVDHEESDEDLERRLFAQAIEDDPEVVEKPKPAEGTLEVDKEPGAVDQAPGDTPAEEAEEAQPTGFEWLDELPEDQRLKAQEVISRQGQVIARLEQRVSSHLGQLQPAQRVISQLQHKLREVEAKLPAETPTTGPQIEAQKAAYNAWADKEYEDFPEEAAKLKTRFAESLDGVLRSIPASPKPQPTVMAGPDPRSEVQHLSTAYSDWGERRYSPEFQAWIGRQAPDTQQLLNSPYAADNIALLDQFTRDNPEWIPPQSAEEFHSLAQAQHSPLYRGWAQAEGINPDMNTAALPDFQRDQILSRFKADLTLVRNEQQEQPGHKPDALKQRRSKQLQDRAPGSRRVGLKPGQVIDLETEAGQREYFKQLIASDPDIR